MMAAAAGRNASFRDPGGRLLDQGDRIFRAVSAQGLENAELYLRSAAVQAFREAGRIVDARVVPAWEAGDLGLEDAAMVLEHPRINFPSYPYEWPPEMLAEAGRLTLDLAEALLAEGLGLKDATPFNILFDGARPVFVDALSIERRDPRDPLWLPMAQFERTFVLPLLALKRGVSLARSLGARREGITPQEMNLLAGPVWRWLPPYLGLAALPATLARSRRTEAADLYQVRRSSSPEEAEFILRRQFGRLRRQLERVAPRNGQTSTWSSYQAEGCHYGAEDLALKDRFVATALDRLAPGGRVLDVGANLGRYSWMAAGRGLRVTAVDSDAVVMGRLWRVASRAGEDILPLVVDLAEPSAGQGWRNAECRPFLDRARGWPDVVLLLAVVHHLVVTAGVPLPEVVSLAASLAPIAVAEYVGPEDPQFRRLCRGRDHLYSGYGEPVWEQAWNQEFAIEERIRLDRCGRVLYRMRRRG
ncbi:MAG: class I SAM-dependent methyltransferase [Bryobacteraceae bacterium]